MRHSGKLTIIPASDLKAQTMRVQFLAKRFSITAIVRSAALLALGLLLINTPAYAADTNQPAPAPAGNASSSDSAPKCVHGCKRWGKVCNVDPRGVYKCRRRCELFGEICE